MVFETVVSLISAISGAVGFKEAVCESKNQEGVISSILTVLFFIVDAIDMTLDWILVFTLRRGNFALRYFEEDPNESQRNGLSIFLGIMLLLSFVVNMRGKYFFRLRETVGAVCITELAVYSFEDTATIYIYLGTTDLYNEDSFTDRMNLLISTGSGLLAILMFWYANYKSMKDGRMRPCLSIVFIFYNILVGFITYVSIDRIFLGKYSSGGNSEWLPIFFGLLFVSAVGVILSIVTIINPGAWSAWTCNNTLSGDYKFKSKMEAFGFFFTYSILIGSAIGLGYYLAEPKNRLSNDSDAGDSGNSGFLCTRTSKTWREVGTGFDRHASSISMNANGTRFIVGDVIPEDDNIFRTKTSVSVYHFTKTDLSYASGTVQHNFNPSNGSLLFGRSVSMDASGDRVVVGSPASEIGSNGFVRVYQLEQTTGTLGRYEPLGDDIRGERKGNGTSEIGYSVVISPDGRRVMDANHDHISIYELVNETGWLQLHTDFDDELSQDFYSRSISMNHNGSRVAFASFREDNDKGQVGGRVRVFQEENEGWKQVGQDIEEMSTDFEEYENGISMSADGNRIAIGSRDASLSSEPVRVRIFEYNERTGLWDQLGEAISDDETEFPKGTVVFSSLSSDGHRVMVGIGGAADAAGRITAAFEYCPLNNNWQVLDVIDPGPHLTGSDGIELSADGSRVLVASFVDSSVSQSYVGVFELD